MINRRYWLGRWILHYLTLLSKYRISLVFLRYGFCTFLGFGLKRAVFRELDFFCWFFKDRISFVTYGLSDFRWLSLDIYHLFDDLKLLIIPGLWKLIRSIA
jgi:hypothetical protein